MFTMATDELTATRPPRPLGRRIAAAAPYLMLAPGLLWLTYFFIWPAFQMLVMSLSSGSLDAGFRFTGTTRAYERALTQFGTQWSNSLLYGPISTILTFLIGFPVAYTIAFRGGRYKNILLFLVIAPFFTSFLIRTISWKILLNDTGPLLGPLKDLHIVSDSFGLLFTPLAVVAGITY